MRYISVVTSAPQQVPAYLYSTASVLATLSPATPGQDYTGLLLAVDSLPGNEDSTAQYQADRLSSGLHGARVHETALQAMAHLAERVLPYEYTRPPVQHPSEKELTAALTPSPRQARAAARLAKGRTGV